MPQASSRRLVTTESSHAQIWQAGFWPSHGHLGGAPMALPIVSIVTVAAEQVGGGPAAVPRFLRGYVMSSLGRGEFGAMFFVCAIS